MGNSSTIHASMNMQNIGSGKINSLSSQYDQLSMKKRNIEKNTSLSQTEKEKRLSQLEQKMQDLSRQIESAEKKSEAKKKARQLKEHQDQIVRTVDPEVAKIMLDIENLTKTLTKVDSANADSTDSENSENEAPDKLKEENDVLDELDKKNDPTNKADSKVDADNPEAEKTVESLLEKKTSVNSSDNLIQDNTGSDSGDSLEDLLSKLRQKTHEKGLYIDETIK